MVRSFMEMDNVQPNQSLLDSSDPTESHFANTHTRSEDGVYIVEYPFKDGAPPTWVVDKKGADQNGLKKKRLVIDFRKLA